MESDVNQRGKGACRAPLISMVALLVVVLVGFGLWYLLRYPRDQGSVLLLQRSIKDLSGDEASIGNAILTSYEEYRSNLVRWSGTYHGCIFVSAALSALTAVILKLEYFIRNMELKKDLAAILAMLSALLVKLSTVGDFQARWQANRIAAGRWKNLAMNSPPRGQGISTISPQRCGRSTRNAQAIVGAPERSKEK